MVLKEKEDLCNWFKVLHPRKRIDYMCGLLHLCLPLELRFIGTVLENIAKENFSFLRDAENKANTVSDITNDDSHDFGDHHFRAKTLVNLALMHSANAPAADAIFKVLEKQFINLTSYSHDEKVMEDVLTLLTLACHHPAFNINQRLRLGEVLKNTEEHCHHYWDNPAYPHFSKNSQSYFSSPVCSRSKDIVFLTVKGIRDEYQNKKSGPDYEILTTWSTGEVTQSFMKYKELQNLHNQIFNKYTDYKKPDFPTSQRRHHRQESKEEKISLMNFYLSELTKVHNVLSCDILTRAFHNGKPVQPPPQFPVASQPFIYPAYMPENRYYGHYPDSPRLSCFTVPAPYSVTVPPTALSSSTTSPANSRSSSPSITITNNKGISHNKIKGVAQQHVQVEPESSVQVEICQLLRLLGLDKYSENLANYSLQEISAMSSEELARLGLPADAHIKLHSKLDQQKHIGQDVNGVIPLSGPISKQDRAVHSYIAWQGQGHLSPDSNQRQQPSSPYPPSHQYHLVSQTNAIHSHPQSVAENSPSASEICTPSLSPGLQSMTDSPPSSLASPTSVYLDEKTLKNQVDSSGSEDDKVIVYEASDLSSYRNVGPSRPQQSTSLPLLNHNASSHGNQEKGKVTGVPASVSAPVMNAESARDSATPPVMPTGIPMMNGFISEAPFIAPNASYVMSHPALHQQPPQHQQQQRYKTAQPTHTGPRMHKNIVNMPGLDTSSQPPPASNINKNNGGMNPVMHPSMLHHYHILPPNLQTNTGILHQPQPTSIGPPQQLPPGQTLMPHSLATDSSGNLATLPLIHTLVPNFIPPHSRGLLTSMSNSSGVINTSSSHPPGQHPIAASHSPSPVASSIPGEQVQINFIHSNPGGDGQEMRPEDSHLSKSGPLAHNNNTSMSHISNKAGPGSGTPSPPLASKQNVTSCITCDSSSHHQNIYGPPFFVIPNLTGNGGMPPYSANPHQQNSLQPFPNGITPDVYPLQGTRFPIPLGSGQLPHFYYGSQAYNQHMHPNANNSNFPHHTAGHGPGNPNSANSNNNNGNTNSSSKSTCYNCGQPGHKGNECKDLAMDSMTNSFRLNVRPKSDSE